MDNATIFFSKTTNRELFKYRNILEFADDSYVLVNPISEYNIREMRNNMEESDVVAFDAFLERNWGIKPPKMPTMGNEETESKEIPKVENKEKIEVKEDIAEQISTLAQDDVKKDVVEKKQTVPTRPVSKPTAGITKDDLENKIRRNVGIKRPAGEAHVQTTETAQRTVQRPVQRPAQRPTTSQVKPTTGGNAEVRRPQRPNPTDARPQNPNTSNPNKLSILGDFDFEDDDDNV